jgi:hypothetical protein
MPNPKAARIELRNKYFDLIRVLNKEASNVSWDYNRIGGCGASMMNLEVVELPEVGADYNIQIRLEDGQGGTNLVYSGYVESNRPVVDVKPSVQLKAFGYSGQLARVRVNETYANVEVSVIVKDILDTYVLPDTSIEYVDVDIEPTGFSIDSLPFDCMADEAMKTLAEIAGGVEWGVDVNRKFFFTKKSDAIRHYLRYKIDVAKFDPLDDYGAIINRLYIKGGKVGGVQFEDTANNSESQGRYGLRSQIISNSSIVTSSVSQRYGTMMLADQAKVQRKISIKVKINTRFFEQTIPLGKISIIAETITQARKYGDSDAIYGKFKYGGNQSFEIDKISYKLIDQGTEVTINAGTARPDVAEEIKKLEFEIQQLRNIGGT